MRNAMTTRAPGGAKNTSVLQLDCLERNQKNVIYFLFDREFMPS